MARDGIYRRVSHLKAILLSTEYQPKANVIRTVIVTCAGVAMLLTSLLAFRSAAPEASAQALRVSSAATCAQLARIDSTVTNGASWGRTILPGHGAPGGWFGVDVCSNGFNSVSPNGSNVSCDNVARGCSPTNDGYGWTFQCPELILRFSAWAFGDSPGDWGRSGWGNAPDLWLPVNHPSDFVMYPNGSITPPVPGDILIWGFLDGRGNPWPAGPDGSHGGHIAVVAAVHGGKVITAEQNVKWGSEDHPSDTLALTKAGARWILSGSAEPATTLPTWRWLRTMGHSRGTFGWLHSVKNNGHFPNAHASSATTAKKPANSNTVSQQFPGGLPSLSAATVVTRSGTLADLTWSTRSFFAPTQDTGQPQAQVRSLGTPAASIRLASNQSAATLQLNTGSRYTYALGSDGKLYAAHTSPTTLGVFWTGLGQPPGVSLTGSPVASLFAGGVQIAARGSDGNLWWRAGPPDRPGNWSSLGSPPSTALDGGLALAGAPGSGSPVAFALGVDSRLYVRMWQEATTAADGTQIPATWSDWMALGAQSWSSHLTGTLLAVPELPSAHNWIGPWPDSPLNLFATDTAGVIWWFRSPHLANGWTATPIGGSPTAMSALLGGVAIPAIGTDTAKSTAGATNEIALYAASRTASYMATFAVPGSGVAATNKPTWATLPDPPAGVAMSASSAAVALGAGNSVLVAAAGDDVVIGGAQTMTAALLPSMAGQAAGNKQQMNPWMRVGAATATATFSDTFIASPLDSRWARSDASVRASVDNHGLVLVPGSRGVAALMQAAAANDVTLTVQIAKPHTLPQKAAIGLVLYQDDADWLTLTVDREGNVRLCPMSQQSASPCMSIRLNIRSSVWLGVRRSDSTFTALASSDGVTWQNVGQWTPTAIVPAKPAATTTATPHAQATPTATATATQSPQTSPTAGVMASPGATDPAAAPLAFSSWGVFAVGDGNGSGWPHITNFLITTAP